MCLGGLIKHVAITERMWVEFVERGTEAMPSVDGEPSPEVIEQYQSHFRLPRPHPLPAAPWFAPGATLSARRGFLHIIAETAQHAGHADIIRETVDGQKTMG